MSRILFYHYSALGDFITLLPLLTFFKRQGNHLTLLGKPAFGEIARVNGSLDESIDAERSSLSFLFSLKPVAEKLRVFLGAFDTIVLFTDATSPLAQNINKYSTVRTICCRPIVNVHRHITDSCFAIFPEVEPHREHRIPDLTNAVSIFEKKIDVSSLPQIHKQTVIFHPGSGSTLKNWPFERFLSVAGRLREKGFSIAWMTGPAETPLSFPSGDLVISNRSIPECMVLLSQCSVYCGNDSGISHLAAAVGCRSVVIFGPSDPDVWTPQGKSSRSIIKIPIACRPCHLTVNNNCNRNCLLQISVDQVFAAIILTIESA